MKYRVGDIVYIRSKKWFDKNSNNVKKLTCDHVEDPEGKAGFTFDHSMIEYCSKKAKISYISDFGTRYVFYQIDIDNGVFAWCDFMFDDVKKIRKRKLKELENATLLGI